VEFERTYGNETTMKAVERAQKDYGDMRIEKQKKECERLGIPFEMEDAEED
jgi:hypothetical protein